VEKYWKNKKDLLIDFIDLEKAYNKILKKLWRGFRE
jgi:hypothetical protein